VVAGVVAAALAAGVTLAIIFAAGGDGGSTTGSLSPLAPDGGAAPGVVQLEPGDAAPPVGGLSATMLAGGPGIAIADALVSTLSGRLLVNGFLVIVDGAPHLCSALAKSLPPQCAGDSVPVAGLDAATLDLVSEGNVLWTAGQVQLLGSVREGVLLIDAASLAAGGGAPPLPTAAE
jgi:hypothetical protein